MTASNYHYDFAAWLREPQQDLSDRTVDTYLGALRVFAGWFEATYSRPFEPRQLTATDVRSYRQELQIVRGHKASTVNVSLAMLRTFARWCIKESYLAENVAAAVSFADLQPQPPRWVTRAELRKLLAEFERQANDADARQADTRSHQARRDMAIMLLMAGAGLRISEALALDLDDIELNERSGLALIRNGKGSLQRQVPLGLEVREALKAHLQRRGRRPGPLFASQKGGRLNPRSFQAAFGEIAARAGVEDATPHSLRHYFVKSRVDNGEPLPVAQKLAGHRRIQTTAAYAAPGRQELAAAAERLF